MEELSIQVCEALADLNLIDTTFSPSTLISPTTTSLSQFHTITSTICEELNPYTFTYHPLQPHSSSNNQEDFNTILSNFLTSLSYPHPDLSTTQGRLEALDFLTVELQTQRLRTYHRTKSLAYREDDTIIAAAVSKIIQAFGVPLDGVGGVGSVKGVDELVRLLGRFVEIIKERGLKKKVRFLVGEGEEDMRREENVNTLEQINCQFEEEYNLRRGLLMKRLYVTVQSFLYSNRCKGVERKEFERKLEFVRSNVELLKQLPVSVMDALVSDEGLLEDERTAVSGGSGRGKEGVRREGSELRKVIIGKVPDRGGRVGKDGNIMPEFKKRLEAVKNKENRRASGKGRGRKKRKR